MKVRTTRRPNGGTMKGKNEKNEESCKKSGSKEIYERADAK